MEKNKIVTHVENLLLSFYHKMSKETNHLWNYRLLNENAQKNHLINSDHNFTQLDSHDLNLS